MHTHVQCNIFNVHLFFYILIDFFVLCLTSRFTLSTTFHYCKMMMKIWLFHDLCDFFGLQTLVQCNCPIFPDLFRKHIWETFLVFSIWNIPGNRVYTIEYWNLSNTHFLFLFLVTSKLPTECEAIFTLLHSYKRDCLTLNLKPLRGRHRQANDWCTRVFNVLHARIQAPTYIVSDPKHKGDAY